MCCNFLAKIPQKYQGWIVKIPASEIYFWLFIVLTRFHGYGNKQNRQPATPMIFVKTRKPKGLWQTISMVVIRLIFRCQSSKKKKQTKNKHLKMIKFEIGRKREKSF